MLLWLDGFDQYGLDETFMLDGAYASRDGINLSELNPRTGTYAIRLNAVNDGGIRRVLGDDYAAVGAGMAVYMPTLPSNSTSYAPFDFRDNNNLVHCGIAVTSSGQVYAYRQEGLARSAASGTILGTSGVCITARGYQHIEAFAVVDGAAGSIEVRVNGVTVLNLTGVNTQNPDAQAGVIAQVMANGCPGGAIIGLPSYVEADDLFVWEQTGPYNDDFIGDMKVYTRFPDGDTAIEEWAPAVGTDTFDNLNKVPPQDDVYFITAEAPGVVSIVEIEDVPTAIVRIAGVQSLARAVKTDAGNAKIVLGVHSGSDFDEGAEQALSMAPSYYSSIFEVDPGTGVPWTPAGFNAATASIERTE